MNKYIQEMSENYFKDHAERFCQEIMNENFDVFFKHCAAMTYKYQTTLGATYHLLTTYAVNRYTKEFIDPLFAPISKENEFKYKLKTLALDILAIIDFQHIIFECIHKDFHERLTIMHNNGLLDQFGDAKGNGINYE